MRWDIAVRDDSTSHIGDGGRSGCNATEPNFACLSACSLALKLQCSDTQPIDSSLVAIVLATDIRVSLALWSGLPEFDKACKRSVISQGIIVEALPTLEHSQCRASPKAMLSKWEELLREPVGAFIWWMTV